MKPLSQLSDEELSGLVAVSVVGLPPQCLLQSDYAASADDVLPLLAKLHWWAVEQHAPERYWIGASSTAQPSDGRPHEFEAFGPTFARTACIALLGLKGITGVES